MSLIKNVAYSVAVLSFVAVSSFAHADTAVPAATGIVTPSTVTAPAVTAPVVAPPTVSGTTGAMKQVVQDKIQEKTTKAKDKVTSTIGTSVPASTSVTTPAPTVPAVPAVPAITPPSIPAVPATTGK